MTTTSRMSCATIVAVAALSMAATAQELTNKTFKTSLALGAAITDGNSQTMQLNGSIVGEGEKEGLGSFRAGIEANYGESTVNETKDTTADNTKLFANAKRTLTPHSFAYADTSVFRDDIALIDYRAILGPGAGYYFLKNDKTTLSAEAGVSYVWEKVESVRDSYTALRAAERFEHKFSETAKLWESVEYIPQADDLENYLVNAEVGVQSALNAHLNLRLVLQRKYDNQPAPDREKADLNLIAGISATF